MTARRRADLATALYRALVGQADKYGHFRHCPKTAEIACFNLPCSKRCQEIQAVLRRYEAEHVEPVQLEFAS